MQIPDIQIINCGKWDNPNKYKKTKPRFVLTYELEYHHVAYGQTVINGHTYQIQENAITFTRPGDLRHGHLTNPDTNTDFFYFIVKENRQNEALIRLLENLPQSFPSSVEATRLWGLLWDAYAAREDTTCEMQASCYLLLLLTHLSQSSRKEQLPPSTLPHQGALFEAIGYMREHLNENVSINDMAAHIGYSPSHFHYLFKSYTQHTPYAYFLSLKINQARYLLLNTDKTLTEISGELGFCKVSQFSSAFKKELQVTPAKFRKQRDVALYND